MVLSGMGSLDMVESNVRTMKPFVPLSDEERAATDRVRGIIREYRQISCTGCRYCADVCPIGIPISELFSVYNEYALARITKRECKDRLAGITPSGSECLECGACEGVCPQSIGIREKLKMLVDMK